MFTPFVPFEDTRIDEHDPGADALLYVLAYDHTISIPTSALYAAEKIAVLAIRRQAEDVPANVLRDVNRALDVIAASLRNRLQVEREETQTAETAPVAPNPSSQPGKFATLQPQPINRPPGAVVKPTINW